jgi:hypothetical protein
MKREPGACDVLPQCRGFVASLRFDDVEAERRWG